MAMGPEVKKPGRRMPKRLSAKTTNMERKKPPETARTVSLNWSVTWAAREEGLVGGGGEAHDVGRGYRSTHAAGCRLKTMP